MVVILSAVLATVIAALLAVAGVAGGWAVTAAAGFCVLALAVGLGDLLRLPHRSGSAVLVAGLGVGGLVAGTLAAAPRSRISSPLALYAAVIAAAVLLSFAHELIRRDGRIDVLESVTGTLFGQILAVLASGWVLLTATPHGRSALIVATAAVAGSRIGTTLLVRLPADVSQWIGAGIGIAAAVAASTLVSGVQPLTAATVGIAVCVVSAAIDRLFPLHETRLDLGVLARAAAPVSAAGTVAYAVFRLGVG